MSFFHDSDEHEPFHRKPEHGDDNWWLLGMILIIASILIIGNL